MSFFKKRKIRSIEHTLKLLSGYHAMPLDNEQFVRQYRHLISMYFALCRETNSKPIL